jgi:hypothetical protein
MPHVEHHYSITCESDDKPVVYCLRSLAHFAEKRAPINAAWGNTGDEYWAEDGHRVTFHFSDPEYRQIFRDVAVDLLAGRWRETGSRDDDPSLTPEEFKRGRRRR